MTDLEDLKLRLGNCITAAGLEGTRDVDTLRAAREAICRLQRELEDARKIPDALVWEATTPVYTRFITDRRYKSLRPNYQKWYRPVCQTCAAFQQP